MGLSSSRQKSNPKKKRTIIAVDLFCGAGGLTRGLQKAGIDVVAGYDIDTTCKFAYEHNNKPAEFLCKSVAEVSKLEMSKLYAKGSWRVLVGCAPCQPFSTYTQGIRSTPDPRWGLLSEFGRLVSETKPHVVSMENVVGLAKHPIYNVFLTHLRALGYEVSEKEVYCPDYGVPQQRTRLVVLASLLGPISLIRRTHAPSRQRRVRDAIKGLPRLRAGEVDASDPLHRAAKLSDKNTQRIKASEPGGSWKDWPEHLVANCHKLETGRTYAGVYGRMEWDEPSPTITTQFYGFGSGRFGHPEQHRGLSLREGALLQTFGRGYRFAKESDDVQFKALGRMIGNAVPVRLGVVVGRSIIRHLREYEKT